MERSDGSTAFMQTPVAEGSSAPPKKSTNQILTTHHTAQKHSSERRRSSRSLVRGTTVGGRTEVFDQRGRDLSKIFSVKYAKISQNSVRFP